MPQVCCQDEREFSPGFFSFPRGERPPRGEPLPRPISAPLIGTGSGADCAGVASAQRKPTATGGAERSPASGCYWTASGRRRLLHQHQHAPLLVAQSPHQPAQLPHLCTVGAMHRAGLHDALQPLQRARATFWLPMLPGLWLARREMASE